MRGPAPENAPSSDVVRYGSDEGGPAWCRSSERGCGRMVVMITAVGVYLILALIFLVLIGGGIIVAYRRSNRPEH
jgi:hypothetical protein